MFNLAIDGPAGAGKSSIAKEAARRLGFIYVDTGALYRSVALYMLEHEIPVSDADAVTAALSEVSVKLAFEDGTQKVLLNGADVSDAIRTETVSASASTVSAIPAVRAFLFDLQRKIAAEADCLMDGRDIGTVVLPDADLKIFLTASPEERARRRYLQLQEKGLPGEYEEILAEVNQRDYQDSHRAIAPLKQAEDAVLLDTTHMSFEEVVITLLKLVEERRK